MDTRPGVARRREFYYGRNLLKLLLPGAGVEPARDKVPRDFKCNVVLGQRVRGRSIWLYLDGVKS